MGLSNKGMKLTKLVAAPVPRVKVPPRAVRRFAAARTASQLIPGVRQTNNNMAGTTRDLLERSSLPSRVLDTAIDVREAVGAFGTAWLTAT